MKYYEDFGDDEFSFGNHPLKKTLRKNKKDHTFKKFEYEFGELDKNRHSYKRTADKSFIRAQSRENQFIF